MLRNSEMSCPFRGDQARGRAKWLWPPGRDGGRQARRRGDERLEMPGATAVMLEGRGAQATKEFMMPQTVPNRR